MVEDGEETFELIVFSSYEIEECAPYRGETSARPRDATPERLDRATVEALVDTRNRGLAHLFVYLLHLSSKE
jgi:hypothetical protein